MQPTANLLGTVPGGVTVRTIDFLESVPQLAEHVDGWEVVNQQIIPAGEYSYLVLFLKTVTTVPDDDAVL